MLHVKISSDTLMTDVSSDCVRRGGECYTIELALTL